MSCFILEKQELAPTTKTTKDVIAGRESGIVNFYRRLPT